MSLAEVGEGCECVADHSPSAYLAVWHHILPKSWGGLDVVENRIHICSNTHEAVHRLIDDHIRWGGTVPWSIRRHFSTFQRELADRAWVQRPAKPTYTLHYHPMLRP